MDVTTDGRRDPSAARWRAALPLDVPQTDATELIPEELVPLKLIGRRVLARWPNNFFVETEQVAFCP